MFKKLLNKKLLKNQKGLTLIELLAVIVILAIVAVIAIPAIGNIIENSRVKAAKADAANIVSAATIYFTDNADKSTFEYNSDADKVEVGPYISDFGTITTFTVTKTSGGNTIKATGTTGGKTYAIAAGTDLKTLKVDKGNVEGDGFTLETKD